MSRSWALNVQACCGSDTNSQNDLKIKTELSMNRRCVLLCVKRLVNHTIFMFLGSFNKPRECLNLEFESFGPPLFLSETSFAANSYFPIVSKSEVRRDL